MKVLGTVLLMRAWIAEKYGTADEALVLRDDWPEPEPGPDDVRIKVQATTLNFNEIDTIAGEYKAVSPPPPFIPGMEALGVVDQAGEHVKDWIGKRVVAIPNGAIGGYAEYAVASVDSTFEMPHDMAQADAAAIFFPFHLGWLALYARAKVTSDDTVLVHAGAGGAGSAVIQLAKARGARVIASSPCVASSAPTWRSTTARRTGWRPSTKRPAGAASTSPSTRSAARSPSRRSRRWASTDATSSSASPRASKAKTSACPRKTPIR